MSYMLHILLFFFLPPSFQVYVILLIIILAIGFKRCILYCLFFLLHNCFTSIPGTLGAQVMVLWKRVSTRAEIQIPPHIFASVELSGLEDTALP